MEDYEETYVKNGLINYLEHVDWNLFKRTEIEYIVDKLDNILHNKTEEDLMKNQNEITEKVTKFIDERFKADNDWTNGNCYFFALILKDVFKGKIFYDDVWGHFVVKIGKEFYDWKGVYTKKDGNLISWKGLKEVDSTHYKRVKKQCCR